LGFSAAIDDRTVQLGAKLTLERVLSSASCHEDLRKAVASLLHSVKSNLERIDAPVRGRRVPRSQRYAHAGPLREQLLSVARPWEDGNGSTLSHDCG
jgi:hypothetical protein